MEIRYRKTITSGEMGEIAKRASSPLDELWKSKWINDAITGAGERLLSDVKAKAAEFAASCDTVILVCGQNDEPSIKACLSAVPHEDGRPDVIVFCPSLSPKDYSDMFRSVEGRKAGLIAVCSAKDDLALRASYAVVKNYVFSRASKEGYIPAVAAVTSRTDNSIAKDAAENEYDTFFLPEGTDPLFLANTAAVLLPVEITSGKGSEYLASFSAMVSSTGWDRDYPAAGLYIAENIRSAAGSPPARTPRPAVVTWQREYEPFARWAANFGCVPVFMPNGSNNNDSASKNNGASIGNLSKNDSASKDNCSSKDNLAAKSGFDLLLMAEETDEDVMTPPFEGCDPDGSLARLLLSEAERDFFDETANAGRNGAWAYEKTQNAASAGEIAAFMQMTFGIVNNILE